MSLTEQKYNNIAKYDSHKRMRKSDNHERTISPRRLPPIITRLVLNTRLNPAIFKHLFFDVFL